MILTVLIGNTHTRLLLWEKNRLRRRRVVRTQSLLENPGAFIPNRPIDGAALASVVPKATLPVYRLLCGRTRTMLVTTRTPTPLKIRYHRRQLGSDRVCVATGGYIRYQSDLIVIDFGTAITVNLIHHRERTFIGGPILPGVTLLLNALSEGTGKLPKIKFNIRKNPLSTSTAPAIRAGVTQMILGGLERIVGELRARTGRTYRVIATGGGARPFVRDQKLIERLDPELASFGLAQLLYFNRRTK